MKEIIRILENYTIIKRDFLWYVILGLIMETLYVVFPYFAKRLYEIIESQGTIEDYYFILGALVIFTFLTIGINFFWEYLLKKIWLSFNTKRVGYYRENIFQKDYEHIVSQGTGKLIAKIQAGVEAETNIFIGVSQILINSIYRGVLVLIVISFLLPQLIIFVGFSLLIIFGANHYLRKYISPIAKKEKDIWEKDGRNGARIIMENFTMRLFGRQDYELKKSDENISKVVFFGKKVDTANAAYYKILELILRLLEVSFFAIIGVAILKTGEYELSFLIVLITYVWYLWWPIDKAVSNLNQINRVWEKYISLQEFRDLSNKIINGDEQYVYKSGSIELKKINFGYSEKVQIFKGLNVEFVAGKKNALVGHSGGGKSTITKLLLRLYEIGEGEILLDGQEIKSLDINSFYSEIGYLPQDPAVFDGTIRENMEYAFSYCNTGQTQGTAPTKDSRGEPCVHPDKEKLIWKALKKARIDDMVKKLEHGLDTEVGERGIKLSGGEKQRLAIARIFLKNPKIIILDEPTSALDSISEAKITESLEDLTSGKTSIVIAHRLQTVMNADKIIVIEDGKVEAEGNHEELITKSKMYKNLVDLQNGKIME